MRDFFLLLGEPERLFENLKKRFSKRKNALKRLKRSGAGRNDGVQKAEEELRKYAFLEWINPYVAARDSISNLDVTPGGSDVVDGNGHEEFEQEENDESNGEEDFEGDDNEVEAKTSKRKIESEIKNVKSNPAKDMKWKKRVTANELMLTINKRLHERSEKSKQVTENHNDDAETIFGKMVADELRALPKRMKTMQLEEHESKASKLSVQPSESTGFRSFTEIINSPSSFSNHEVNETPYYHTFAMTGTHSQAIAGDVDGTPQIPNMSYRQMIEERNL